MNSAMSTITYSSESCEFEWNNLSPSTVGTIQSEALQLGGSYWYAIALFGNATLLMLKTQATVPRNSQKRRSALVVIEQTRGRCRYVFPYMENISINRF
jgi:hypothetical protein